MRISPYALLPASLLGRNEPTVSLATLSLNKVLQDASPVFGNYIKQTGPRAEWMKRYPDNTELVHMNIPGVHDSATWNYTQATQDKLLGITNLEQAVLHDPRYFRCQDTSIVDALNSGIRVFDLRYALDVTNTTLVFFHAQALQSQTASVEDVLFGFYQWLTDHPSETVMLSFQYEGSTMPMAQNNAAVQLALYNTLTSPSARKFFVQTKGRLGTLGEARGKITLLRRFDMDQLPSSYEDSLPGLHFSPNLWTDNGVDIALQYNAADNLTAYVEDYYNPTTDIGSSAEENIVWKYNATFAHINKAVQPQYRNDLFWTWASSENVGNLPPNYPETQALGNGTQYTSNGGVNNRLVPFLKKFKGKRVGIVMFDFFEEPSDLLETFLGLL